MEAGGTIPVRLFENRCETARIPETVVYIMNSKLAAPLLLSVSFACGSIVAAQAGDAFPVVQESKSVFEHFITRDGDRLMEGNEEFRFAGANMPGLSLPYDYTLRLPDRLALPTVWEQSDGLKTAVQMNARVVRLWNLAMRGPDDDWMDWAYVQGPGRFSEEAFKTLDNLLALANRYRIRIIFSLGAERGDYLGGVGEYSAWRGKDRSEFYTDEQLKNDYKATLRYVVNRRNTVTGQLYRDDKAILAWQLGNELRTAPLDWEAEMASFLKSMDPNHLVMAGNDDRVPDDPPDDLDILVRHYYGLDWEEEVRKDWAIAKGKRPFIVGEYGLEKDIGLMRRFHEEVYRNGASGSLIWSIYFHHRFGGFYWHQIFTRPSIGSFHWPGFASGAAHNERGMLHVLREYGFRMEGLEVPDMPVPEKPSLLPMTGDLPLLTWRGSAGASGYDIERSESASGPWKLVAQDVSDASVAYRPLYADSSAELGRDYFYRVRARNSSGVSEPSGPLGPLRFRAKVLVDEFHDLQRAEEHSKGLRIDNSYNGVYAEYLFRCEGKEGDFLLYKTPGAASALRLWAFYSDASRPPRISVSTGKGQWKSVALNEVSATKLQSFEKVRQLRGMKRTLVEYEGSLPTGSHEVRIDWQGAMKLDRMEIEYGE